MALFTIVTKRIAGILPKPTYTFYQRANCGTTSQNTSKENSLVDDCQADSPVEDMENPYQKERRQCILCKMNITPSYKNPKLLSQFVSMYTGKIYGRHITGLCRRRQEQVESEIIKCQGSGMMPYYLKDPAFMQDPQLFNPETPFRNHHY